MNLIYGVLRQRQFLDFILQERSKTPIRKLHPFVHQSLAVGLYQIFFLASIPHSAAVNEAVNSCKVKGVPKRLHGFVNGVLRETIRRKEKTIPAAKSNFAKVEAFSNKRAKTRYENMLSKMTNKRLSKVG